MSIQMKQSDQPILLCMTESDAHVVALKLLELYLVDQGWLIINLGACTPLRECMTTAAMHAPLAVVIGTQNGHAVNDLTDLRSLRRELGVDSPVIVGGNLSVGSSKGDDTESVLHSLGIERIISDFESLQKHLLDLSAAPTLPLREVV